MDRLFVYGTLRLGSTNAYAQKLASEAHHVGRGQIRGRLYRVTHYPALAEPQRGDDFVTGDVFEGISGELWRELDGYEGDEYVRESTEVLLESGESVTAFVYRYLPSTNQLKRIRSGDWHQPDRIES